MPAAVPCSTPKQAFRSVRIRRCESAPIGLCPSPSRSMRWIRKRRHITPRPMGVSESRIAFCLLACPAVFAANLHDGFNLSEPKAGVFVHIGRQLPLDAPSHDDVANIGFIIGKKCVAVIDTGGSMRIGRELRAAVLKHTSLPVCYVINTHAHVD